MTPAAPVPPLLERVRRTLLPGRREVPETVLLRQEGSLRLEDDGPWKPFVATQETWSATAAFRWCARLTSSRWLGLSAEDSFLGEVGGLTVRLWNRIPVARFRGPEVDRAECQRYLAEIPLCPWALVANEELAWSAEGERTLVVRWKGRDDVAVSFEVDDEGRPSIARALRPRREGKSFVDRRWRGTFREWTARDGVLVPAYAEVAWLLPEAPLFTWRARILA